MMYPFTYSVIKMIEFSTKSSSESGTGPTDVVGLLHLPPSHFLPPSPLSLPLPLSLSPSLSLSLSLSLLCQESLPSLCPLCRPPSLSLWFFTMSSSLFILRSFFRVNLLNHWKCFYLRRTEVCIEIDHDCLHVCCFLFTNMYCVLFVCCLYVALQNENTSLKLELSELRGEIMRLRKIRDGPTFSLVTLCYTYAHAPSTNPCYAEFPQMGASICAYIKHSVLYTSF